MRYLILAVFSYCFYVGFFTNSVNIYIPSILTDKDLHLLVFFFYPLLVKTLFQKIPSFILLIVFSILAFGVEYLQDKFFNRVCCFTDLKYSLFGVGLSFICITYSNFSLYRSKAKS